MNSKLSSEDFNSYFQQGCHHRGTRRLPPRADYGGQAEGTIQISPSPSLRKRGKERPQERGELSWSLLLALCSMLFASLPDFHMQGFGLFAAQDPDGVGVPVSELLIEGDRIFEGADLPAVHTSNHIPVFKAH